MRRLAILALLLAPALPAHAQDQQDPAEPLAETFGIETGPSEFEDIDGLDAEDLIGTPLMDAKGDQIGTIENIVIIEDETDKLVIGTGGYGELSTRKVLIELSDVRIENVEGAELRVVTPLTDEQLDTISTFEST